MPYSGDDTVRASGMQGSATTATAPTIHKRLQKRRHALADTTAWVNNQPSSPISIAQTQLSSSPPAGIPHHTSLAPGGLLQTCSHLTVASKKIEDKRISAISIDDAARDSNRDSQLTASTENSAKSKRKVAVGPWRLGKDIGKGAFGRVRKARHKYTGQDAAIKIISKKAATMPRSESLMALDMLVQGEESETYGAQGQRVMPFGIERECAIMKLMEHPNVISLYDVWENRGELYLVLEYVQGGELFEYISNNGYLPEPEAIRIFRQIIAGLSYCHSFNICHRDLKPENILLDGQGNVKIADFGMAALQPRHNYLYTPCGSPHYACPEIIMNKPYRGDKADVWSSGVVLYAMLGGCLPFHAPKLSNGEEDNDEVKRKVTLCDYAMHEAFSDEAKDFIWRILQQDPEKRLRIRHMWGHPLMAKYAHLDNLNPEGQAYIGPPMPLTMQDCGPVMNHTTDIDKELLRSLHMLWHNVPEAELAKRLLSQEGNHERIIYTKLMKFKELTLENFDGANMDYSASDYHHAHTRPSSRSSGRLDTDSNFGMNQRQQSQYSLLQPVPRPPLKHSARSSAAYRRISKVDTQYTELDPPPKSTRRYTSLSHADHSRVAVLKGMSTTSLARIGGTSLLDNSSSDMNASVPVMPPSSRRISRVHSKMTVTSRRSAASNSSRVYARKPSSYKPDVIFQHTSNRTTAQQQRTTAKRAQVMAFLPGQTGSETEFQALQSVEMSSSQALPALPTAAEIAGPSRKTSLLVQKKRIAAGDVQSTKSELARRQSQRATTEARQVSTELARLCDQSWNRESVTTTTTNMTPSSEFRASYRSYGSPVTTSYSITDMEPPSSKMSVHLLDHPSNFSAEHRANRRVSAASQERPGTSTSLGTYTRREIARTRDLLETRARESCMTPGYLDDVIAYLDRLIEPGQLRQGDEQRRAISTPNPVQQRKDSSHQFLEKSTTEHRSISEPVKPMQQSKGRVTAFDEHRKIERIRPLTIRKKSSFSAPSTRSPTPTQQLFHKPAESMTEETSLAKHKYPVASLDAIHEDHPAFSGSPKRLEPGSEKKKVWFRRNHQRAHQSQDTDGTPQSIPFVIPESQTIPRRESVQNGSVHERSDTVPFSTQARKTSHNSRSRFLKLFANKGHMRSASEPIGKYELDDAASESTTSASAVAKTHLPPLSLNVTGHHPSASTTTTIIGGAAALNSTASLPTSPTDHKATSQTPSWLTRIFHSHLQLLIKPASTALLFTLSLTQTRRHLLRLFRSWKPYGLVDITITPKGTTPTRISATLSPQNSLGLKAVTFTVEIQEVLRSGKRIGTSMVIFRQVKGAKSSFERVVEEVEERCGKAKVLLSDELVKRDMLIGLGFAIRA